MKLTPGEKQVLNFMCHLKSNSEVDVQTRFMWYAPNTYADVWHKYRMSPNSLRSLQRKELVREESGIFIVTDLGKQVWEAHGGKAPQTWPCLACDGRGDTPALRAKDELCPVCKGTKREKWIR